MIRIGVAVFNRLASAVCPGKRSCRMYCSGRARLLKSRPMRGFGRGEGKLRAPAALSLLLALGCGSHGAVTFSIVAPTVAAFDPLTPQVSEYVLHDPQNELIGVASVNLMSPQQLALGPLRLT